MNTTQRILSNGATAFGCRAFLRKLHENNPLCGHHWDACIANNPGGQMPDLNPTEWDEQINKMVTAYVA